MLVMTAMYGERASAAVETGPIASTARSVRIREGLPSTQQVAETRGPRDHRKLP